MSNKIVYFVCLWWVSALAPFADLQREQLRESVEAMAHVLSTLIENEISSGNLPTSLTQRFNDPLFGLLVLSILSKHLERDIDGFIATNTEHYKKNLGLYVVPYDKPQQFLNLIENLLIQITNQGDRKSIESIWQDIYNKVSKEEYRGRSYEGQFYGNKEEDLRTLLQQIRGYWDKGLNIPVEIISSFNKFRYTLNGEEYASFDHKQEIEAQIGKAQDIEVALKWLEARFGDITCALTSMLSTGFDSLHAKVVLLELKNRQKWAREILMLMELDSQTIQLICQNMYNRHKEIWELLEEIYMSKPPLTPPHNPPEPSQDSAKARINSTNETLPGIHNLSEKTSPNFSSTQNPPKPPHNPPEPPKDSNFRNGIVTAKQVLTSKLSSELVEIIQPLSLRLAAKEVRYIYCKTSSMSVNSSMFSGELTKPSAPKPKTPNHRRNKIKQPIPTAVLILLALLSKLARVR